MTNGNNNHSESGCGSGPCGASGGGKKQDSQFPAGEDLKQRMSRIKHKILILSIPAKS